MSSKEKSTNYEKIFRRLSSSTMNSTQRILIFPSKEYLIKVIALLSEVVSAVVSIVFSNYSPKFQFINVNVELAFCPQVVVPILKSTPLGVRSLTVGPSLGELGRVGVILWCLVRKCQYRLMWSVLTRHRAEDAHRCKPQRDMIFQGRRRNQNHEMNFIVTWVVTLVL